MHAYELVLILKEDRDETVKKITTDIEAGSGKVTAAEKWGKKDLSYPIKKCASGYYHTWQIELNHKKVNDFKKKLEYDEDVLRYLLIKHK